MEGSSVAMTAAGSGTPFPTSPGGPAGQPPPLVRKRSFIRLSLDMDSVDVHANTKQARRIMLVLSAATTLVAVWLYTSLGSLIDSDDTEDESRSDMLQATIVVVRVWALASALVGAIAAKGLFQTHLPSIRLFALHAAADTTITALLVLIFSLCAFSPSVSTSLGHTFCEHLTKSDSFSSGFLLSSPGSGLENCEEKWSYGIAPLLLVLAGVSLFIRARTALFIWAYYRQAAKTEGSISLESPSLGSVANGSSFGNANGAARSRAHTTGGGKHSRSSSTASTVRQYGHQSTASRIMLLPPDYEGGFSSSSSFPPSLKVSPPTPILGPSSSSESLETVKPASPRSTHRKRSMSNDSVAQSHGVIVYAPILMSIEEAQQLGGKEALIASSPLAHTTTPRQRHASPPLKHPYNHHQPQTQSAYTQPRSAGHTLHQYHGREGSNDSTATVVQGGAPFSNIKGYRETQEMEDLSASATKKA